MKIKTLLLGTAAAFAVSGGAQAADLAIAVEPVDYVKVCDAFGTGYFYIPGTDTCLKIGGYVQLDVVFGDDVGKKWLGWYAESEPAEGGDELDRVLDLYSDYSADWEMKTEMEVTFSSKTMSDLGPVTTFVAIRAVSNNASFKGGPPGSFNDNKFVYIDNAYATLGPILFGWTASTYDYGGGLNTYEGARLDSDTKTDQIRWSYAMGNWGLLASVEDPRDRWDGTASGDMPDIILAITGAAGGWDWKGSVGVTDRTGGTGWGAQLAATVDVGGGFKFRLKGAYSDDAPSFVGGPGSAYGEWWSVLGALAYALTPNIELGLTANYLDGPGTDAVDIAGGIYWAPTATSHVGIEVEYQEFNPGGDLTTVTARLKNKF